MLMSLQPVGRLVVLQQLFAHLVSAGSVTANWSRLQANIKKDPDGYKDEFILQVKLLLRSAHKHWLSALRECLSPEQTAHYAKPVQLADSSSSELTCPRQALRPNL